MNASAKLVKRFPEYRVLDDEEFRNSQLKLVHSSRTSLSKLGNFYIEPVKKNDTSSIDPFDFDKEYFSLGDLLKINIEKYPFLLEPFLPMNLISVLSADNGLGKSTWYSELAIAIVQGKSEIWGLKLNPRLKKVLIVSTEDTALLLADRFKTQLRGQDVSSDMEERLQFYTGDSEIFSVLEEKLKEFRCDLLVIDAYYDVYKGNPFLPTDTRDFLNRLNSLIKKYKCTIMIVTHDVKGGKKTSASKTKVSGSGAIVDKARSVFTMLRSNNKSDLRYIKVTKTNVTTDDIAEKKIALRLDPESRTFSRDYKSEKEDKLEKNDVTQKDDFQREASKPGRKADIKLICLAFKLKAEGMKQYLIAEKVGRKPGTVSKWLSGPRPICDENDLYKEVLTK